MKIDRLIGILSVLLQKDTVTAPYLAEKFEVSRRTINRDIEDLCKAGIPIVTRQGRSGGISIMEDYKMDRTLFTSAEMREILAGLRSLDSVSGSNKYGQLMEKLSAGSSDFMTGDQSVLIDLSSWYKEMLVPRIGCIRAAIESRHIIAFHYFSPRGESRREIEPYYLLFRWSGWYVWGWCTDKKDFRLFKLNRMEELEMEDTVFGKRAVPMPDLHSEKLYPGGIRVQAVFEPECKWRLVEEFGKDCFSQLPDGKLLFHGDYTNREALFGWILSFGDRAELKEPRDIREELERVIRAMGQKY